MFTRSSSGLARLFFCSAVCLKTGKSDALTRRTIVATLSTIGMAAAAPESKQQQQFWNRELSAKRAFDLNLPAKKEANVVCVGDPNDAANHDLYKLTERTGGVKVVQVGDSVESFDTESLKKEGANVLFVSYTPKAREVVASLLDEIPTIQWIHCRSAGIDFVSGTQLKKWATADESNIVTNAKGSFSSTLAEYSMLACSYFAKDLPRLMGNKSDKNWEKYPIKELRGSTFGVVGYGDIGKAAARLAHAYGMKVHALKRRPPSSGEEDAIAEVVYGSSKAELQKLFASCDYILCSLPLTPDTKGMIGKAEFDVAKEGGVFVNVGRGPIVDEPEMIAALRDGRLKGVGLDVFAVEPLPVDSPLWTLDNVLLSPHNMDMTETFMQEATSFFVEENLPRFVRECTLLNPVDPVAGY